MKIAYLGVLLVLISSVLATAAETADVSLPVHDAKFVQQDVLSLVPSIGQEKQDSEQAYYYIHYAATNKARSQNILQNALDLIYYIPEDTYLARASPAQLQELQKKGVILSSSLVRENKDRYFVGENREESLYYVYAFKERDVTSIVSALENKGIRVIDTHDYMIVVDLTDVAFAARADLLASLVQIEGVEAIEQMPHREVLNDQTNVVVGTTFLRQHYGLYGAGQIIAIADTGLDTGVLSTIHPDIRGRIVSLTNNVYDPGNFCPGNHNSLDDPTGHGTAVTGTALGNGMQSGSDPAIHSYPLGSYAGAAPEARLVFMAVGCGSGISAQPPLQLNTLAYMQGARVLSKSYTSGVQDGGYYIVDRDNDASIRQSRTLVLTAGAGNNGQASSTTTNNAKNIITVGGVIKDQPNTQIYSRGPTKDGRIKPDILSVAGALNGAGVTTTRSSVQTVPGCQQINSNYCYISGTSISTPNVAGAAALMREYFQTKRNVPNPSAALIKATILNGGQTLGNGIPDTNYGWGRMDLANTFNGDPYVDFSHWDVMTGLTTNAQVNFTLSADASRPLRVTLDWTDKEACPEPTCSGSLPKLVNDLDLVVIGPDGQVYNGNDHVTPYNNEVDRLNNVERVEIRTPVPGVYTVQVNGYNVPQGPQDFALVATYDNLLYSYVSTPLAQECMVAGVPC